MHSFAVKFVIIPFFRVPDDVVGDVFIGAAVTDYDVVVEALPLECIVEAVAVFGDGGFVSADDGGDGAVADILIAGLCRLWCIG
ncbi:hypothetical protein [Persicobacter diffluens]|uniref:hypothetical protein n=1 Tax=Persicobacter diffluens TaxID=981 RepID=UPI0030C70614